MINRFAPLILALATVTLWLRPAALEAAEMGREVHLLTRESASAVERQVVMLAREGKIEESLKYCERRLKAKPQDPHMKLLKAQIMRFLLEDDEAEKLLHEIEFSDDLDLSELKAATTTAEALDLWPLTKVFAQRALSRFPKNVSSDLFLSLGNASGGLGHSTEAEKYFLKAVSLDRGQRSIETIIYFYRAQKKPEMVVKYCSMALERNRDNNSMNVVRHHKYRAESLMQLSRNKEALADLNYCIEKTPSDSRLYRQRAEVYERLGKKDKIAADRKKAVEIDKGFVNWK
jgi:tetratricopeptide (TPR) repeat protein